MLMLTKRLAIMVAAVLGAASGVTWVVPTSAQTAHSKIEKKISDVTHLKTGDFVRPRTGGPLMSVDSIENGHVTTSWWSWSEGSFRSGKFPIKMLMGPITAPPTHGK